MSNINDFVIENGELIKYNGEGGTVVIPDGVTRIGDYAFHCCFDLTSVSIPETVICIGKNAFQCCSSLTDLVLPDKITSIQRSAFDTCGALRNITLPPNIASIENGVFYNCGTLESVSIPEGVISIGANAFENCKALAGIKIPDNVVSIGFRAFSGCKALTSIKIPNNVVSIGFRAFSGCTSLVGITIPEKVRTIGARTFEGCANLKKISLSRSVKSIGEGAFEDCDKLYEMHFSDGIPNLKFTDGEQVKKTVANAAFYIRMYLFGDDMQNTEFEDACRKRIVKNMKFWFEIALKQGSTVATNRILNCKKKVELSVLENFLELAIKNEVVEVISCLIEYKNKTYSSSQIKRIKEDTIEKDLGFRERTLSDWKKIYVFEVKNEQVIIKGYKGNETDLIIPDSIGNYPVVAIGKFAFSPCAPRISGDVKNARENLTSVVIPSSIKIIEEGAFKGCDGLADKDGMFIHGSKLLWISSNKTSLTIPENITQIDFYAIFEPNNKYTFASKVKCKFKNNFLVWVPGSENGSNIVFKKDEIVLNICENIADGKIKDGMYGEYITGFYIRDTRITTLVVHESVEHLGLGAFSGFTKLNRVVLPQTLISIGYAAFQQLPKLKEIYIPENVTRIGQTAFYCNPELVIHTPWGSYAETYAKENKIPFVAE